MQSSFFTSKHSLCQLLCAWRTLYDGKGLSQRSFFAW